MKTVHDQGMEFNVLVAPRKMQPLLLKLAHDNMGHNGANRTHMLLKREYFWPRMFHDVRLHVKQCLASLKRNKQVVRAPKLTFAVPNMPMSFISMDLIGPFPRSEKGNVYALTAVCMLTGFAFCIPIPDKTEKSVLDAYLDRIHGVFGPPLKILTDNGTEFKNSLFHAMTEEHQIEHVFSPPYHPQSNGRIEGLHYFLKSCISKYVTDTCEWDQVMPNACLAYNYFPGEGTREAPFFLMFGRDPTTPLNSLLRPKVRYVGDKEGLTKLQAIRHIWWVAAENLRRSQAQTVDGELQLHQPGHKFQEGDHLLVRDHTATSFDNRYPKSARIVEVLGASRLKIEDTVTGKTRVIHVNDAKKVPRAESLKQALPDLSLFGRSAKWSLDPSKLPDVYPRKYIMARQKQPRATPSTSQQ